MSGILDDMMQTPSLAHQVAGHSVDNTLLGPSPLGSATFLRNLADDIEAGYFTVTTISRGEHLSNNAPAAVTLSINLIPMHKPEYESRPIGMKDSGPFSRQR